LISLLHGEIRFKGAAAGITGFAPSDI